MAWVQIFFLIFFRRIIDLKDATSKGRSLVSGDDTAGAGQSNLQVAGKVWTHNSIINRLDMHLSDYCSACDRLGFVRPRVTSHCIVRIVRRRACVI